MLKLLTLLVAGILTVVTVRRVMQQMAAGRIKAKAQRPAPRAVTRLRQDPNTGIYYPEA